MEYTSESVNCNICGSNNEDVITKDDKYDYSLTMVLCKTCGLGYLNPRWTEDEYQRFYSTKYDKEYRANISGDSVSNEIKNFPLIDRIKKQGLFPESVASILDIGCGAGDLLMSLSAEHPKSELFGIEPSITAQGILTKRGVDVISTNVNDDWNESHTNKFDVIILRHVLEHMLDPKAVLEKIKTTLKPTGILYIAVPNNLFPVHHLRSKWFRVVHTFYFNRYSLRNLVERAGYEVLHLLDEDGIVKGEVFTILKKTYSPVISETSSEHYRIQKEVFVNKAKEDKKLINVLKNKIRSKIFK